jgi:hypothetical protein
MTADDERYEFTDAADARAYRGAVARLWGGWMVGLVTLLLLRGPTLAGAALVVVVVMLWLSRPFHRRARAAVEKDELVGSRVEIAFGRGTRRDRMLRALMYGDRPMRHALEVAGLSPHWIVLRGAAIVGTVAAAVVILFRPL